VEWFGDSAINAPATDLHKMMREIVTSNQMDPQEVVQRMVELVEADTTTENNFVPANIVEMLNAANQG
jgi:chorismate mutase